MDPSAISYLLRYAFAIIIIFVVVRLLYLAIREMRWSVRHAMRPAQGYFLMALDSGGALDEEGAPQVMSVPLYPTTTLGTGRNSEIRLTGAELGRRHGVIYRYDGSWYIQPQSGRNIILLNDEAISESTRLHNQDVVLIGEQAFIFVDERSEAKGAGLPFDEAAYDDLAFYSAIQNSSRQPYFPWFLMNLFTMVGIYAVTAQIEPELQVRRDFFWMMIAFLAIVNLYMLVLPRLLRYADRVMVLATGMLMSIGLLLQGRLTFVSRFAVTRALEEGDTDRLIALRNSLWSSFNSQWVAMLLGLFFCLIVALIVSRTRWLESLTLASAIVTPLLLIITLIFARGRAEWGAGLWIIIGGRSIQLTEFAKITYLVTLASFFKNRPPLKQQIAFAVWAGIVVFLFMLLPDLGAVMILLPTTVFVYIVMTSEYLKGLLIVAAASLMGVVAYGLFPHVQRRLDGWSSLWVEVNDGNRQIVYGLQAVARGGVLGKGVGNGSPGGIPLASSDMVFVVAVEELGMILGVAIVLLFLIMLLRAGRIGLLGRDGFTSSLAIGVGLLFFMEALVVIAGTTGIIPLTGATLPFIASGGSSLMAKLILVGLFLGLAARHEEGANRI